MTTKEKILEAARRLFNDHGVDNVTVRSIAQELEISHGNLCYHFANTDVLIERLYQQLADSMSAAINQMTGITEIRFDLLQQGTAVTFALLYEYRFLMRDFAGIMQRLPQVRQQHLDLMKRRRTTFQGVLNALRHNGLLRPELYPGHDAHMMEQLLIVGDFWIASAEVIYEGPETEKLNHYQRIFQALLVPMLTQKGLMEWHNASQKQSLIKPV